MNLTGNKFGLLSLGAELKKRRIAAGLTLTELAGLCGISDAHLSRIEIGARAPSATSLVKIGRPLGLDERELARLVASLLTEELETTRRAGAAIQEAASRLAGLPA